MRLLVTLEHHFVRCSEGVFTDLSFSYDYWEEYLGLFDEVIVAARVKNCADRPEGLMRADGRGVQFFDISDFRGVLSFLKKAPRVFWQTGKAVRKIDRYLLRTGIISILVWIWLQLLGRRQYAFECGGHVREGITTDRPKTILYKSIALITHVVCKAQVRFARCASYTSNFLRNCYPCRNRQSEFVFSGVRLTEDIVTSPRDEQFFRNRPFRFLSVGRLEPQKGHLVMINAAATLINEKELPEWELEIVGPGSQVEKLRGYIKEIGISDRVRLVGGVKWGDHLFSYVDRSHLFVLPSLTEGMPRSLIEGMARGIPAIGSRTGGIPELLQEEDFFPPGDVLGMANKMAERMKAPVRLASMSENNFKRALEFRIEFTKTKKTDFWRCIVSSSVARIDSIINNK